MKIMYQKNDEQYIEELKIKNKKENVISILPGGRIVITNTTENIQTLFKQEIYNEKEY